MIQLHEPDRQTYSFIAIGVLLLPQRQNQGGGSRVEPDTDVHSVFPNDNIQTVGSGAQFCIEPQTHRHNA